MRFPAPTVEIYRKDRWIFASRIWFLAAYVWIFLELFVRDNFRAGMWAILIWFCGSAAILIVRLIVEAILFFIEWRRIK